MEDGFSRVFLILEKDIIFGIGVVEMKKTLGWNSYYDLFGRQMGGAASSQSSPLENIF